MADEKEVPYDEMPKEFLADQANAYVASLTKERDGYVSRATAAEQAKDEIEANRLKARAALCDAEIARIKKARRVTPERAVATPPERG